jgi:hypothetical protein
MAQAAEEIGQGHVSTKKIDVDPSEFPMLLKQYYDRCAMHAHPPPHASPYLSLSSHIFPSTDKATVTLCQRRTRGAWPTRLGVFLSTPPPDAIATLPGQLHSASAHSALPSPRGVATVCRKRGCVCLCACVCAPSARTTASVSVAHTRLSTAVPRHAPAAHWPQFSLQ